MVTKRISLPNILPASRDDASKKAIAAIIGKFSIRPHPALGWVLAIALVPAQFALSHQAHADDPLAGCRNAIELFEKDRQAAEDEAQWCVDSLKQLRQDAVADGFKDKVGEFVGGEVEQQNALGMASVSRKYVSNGQTITVQQMEMGGNPLGALGALAQFGGGRKVRISGNSGTLMSEGKKSTLMMNLSSGAMLNFESYDVGGDEVVSFARTFLE